MEPEDGVDSGVIHNDALLVNQSLSDIYSAAAILAEREVSVSHHAHIHKCDRGAVDAYCVLNQVWQSAAKHNPLCLKITIRDVWLLGISVCL